MLDFATFQLLALTTTAANWHIQFSGWLWHQTLNKETWKFGELAS